MTVYAIFSFHSSFPIDTPADLMVSLQSFPSNKQLQQFMAMLWAVTRVAEGHGAISKPRCAINNPKRGLISNTETHNWGSARQESDSTCRWSSKTGCPEGNKGCKWTWYPVTLPVAGIHVSCSELWLCSLTCRSRGPTIFSAAKREKKGLWFGPRCASLLSMESPYPMQRKPLFPVQNHASCFSFDKLLDSTRRENKTVSGYTCPVNTCLTQRASAPFCRSPSCQQRRFCQKAQTLHEASQEALKRCRSTEKPTNQTNKKKTF